jgi:glutamate-5-semialdehyde dehydrogenase
LYLDEKIKEENFSKAINVIINAKTNRVSVCNALDTLIVNKNINKKLLDKLFNNLKNN